MSRIRPLVSIVGALAAQICLGQKPTLYYIPHTHWEGAVFNTREEYMDIGLKHILEAMRLMERFPEYKFTLDQVAYFKPFLERFPEQSSKFREFIKEGRLEIVGGMDVMPDDVKVGGESFVRQVQYGKGFCRKELGLDVDVAWLLDTFGHHPQMPQLLAQSGFKSFWFCRGIPSDTAPSEFLWRGIDGSSIPAFCLPGFYGLFYGPPHDFPGFEKFFKDRYNFLNPNARALQRVGLAGVDVSEPEDYVTPLVDQFDKGIEPFTIRYSTPTEFADVVAKRKDTPTFDYDLNPVFPGTFSSRVELKQRAKEVETKLLNAEQISSDCDLVGEKGIDGALWQAWEPLIFNLTHDLASGTMNDHVYHDTVRSYDFSERLGDEALANRLKLFCKHIDTGGEGSPVFVFNTQGHPRTDLVDVEIGFTQTGVQGFAILDPNGKAAPFQATLLERYGDGALKRAKVTFVARDVPACGYAVYRVVGKSQETKPEQEGPGDTIENEFYRVRVDPRTGAILNLIDLQTGSETLSGPANVVARSKDDGDLWELYHSLDGASHLPTMLTQPVPTAQTAVLSTSFADKPGNVRRGDAYQEFSLTHPFGSGNYATRIRLARGVKRVDIETDLVNRDRNVRYQVLFPSAVKDGKQTQEIPFGSIVRPPSVEYPAQNWVDFGNARGGFSVINEAMPGNVVTDGTLMLSMMRAVGEGDYNGGDTSDTGQELNVMRTLRYALAPHEGSWRQAGIPQEGQDFNSPLLAFKVEPHRGSMPKTWGLVSVSAPNAVITSVKEGLDGTTVVRFYESWGQPTKKVILRFGAAVSSAWTVNLLEDTTGKLSAHGNEVSVDLHPFEIKTLKVKLRSPGAQR